MAINERLIHTAADAAGNAGQEGLILHLDANDVDSYDGDGDVWYDISDHEYTPALDPAEHFNTVTYTGSGDTTNGQSITGVGFQPDLVWIKSTGTTYNHVLYDSVRGVNSAISSNLTDDDWANQNRFESFDSDGFSIEADNAADYWKIDRDGQPFVAWCFKAGGAPTATNTATSGAMTANSVSIDGELQSAYTPSGSPDIYPEKMSINTDLGFSIVKYDGSNAQDTFPHGLGQKPELVIFKRTNIAASWLVTDGTQMGYLDGTDSFTTTRHNQYIASMDANTIEVKDVAGINDSGDEMIAYCFTSKRGVSKAGSYTGTGSSGNKVYTGFQPAFVLQKRTNTSGANWHIFDNKRDTANPITELLIANTTAAEGTISGGIDFNADGFTLDTTNAALNGSGNTYIYLAFAKSTNETQLTPEKGEFVAEDTVTTGAELELDANDYSGSGNWLNTGDASGGDGTISGASYSDDGTQSDYFSFDGVDDEVTFSLATFPNTTFTIEVWFYMTSLPSSGNAYGVVSWGDETAGERRSIIIWNGGSGNPHVYFSGFGSAANIAGTTELSAGVWYHAAVTVDNGAVNIYLNGEGDGSGSATLNNFTGTTGRVGNTGTVSENFNGKIGLVRIYDTELTGSEIRANYDATYGLYQYADLELHLDAASFDGSTNTPTTWTALTGSNGTITGATFDSELGNYLNITSGSTYIDVPTANMLDSDFTIEMWYNIDSISSSYKMLLGGSGYSTQTGLGHYIYNNTIKTWISISGTATEVLTSSSVLVANKWLHIVLKREGSTWTQFVDGEQVGTTTGSTVALSSSNSRIGGHYNDASYPALGEVGQVRIYSTALTQAQIRQNFNFTKNDYPNGFNGTITGASFNPAGYFDFSASSNKIVVDNSKFYDNFTVSLWVKFDSVNPASGYVHSIFSKNVVYASSHSAFPFAILNDTAGQIKAALSYGNDYSYDVTVTGSISASTWYHVAVTVGKGDKMKLYLTAETGTFNTTPTSESSYTGTVVDGVNKKYTIGNAAGEHGGGVGKGFLNGQISKVKMYDKVLTASEVSAQFSEGK